MQSKQKEEGEKEGEQTKEKREEEEEWEMKLLGYLQTADHASHRTLRRGGGRERRLFMTSMTPSKETTKF